MLDSRVSGPLSGHLRNWDLGRSWTVLEARVAGPTHLVHGAISLLSRSISPETSSTHWIPASVLTHLSLPQSSPVRWPPDSQRPPYSNQTPGTDSGCPRGPGHLARSAEGCYRGFWDDPGGARSGGLKSHPYFKTALPVSYTHLTLPTNREV